MNGSTILEMVIFVVSVYDVTFPIAIFKSWTITRYILGTY